MPGQRSTTLLHVILNLTNCGPEMMRECSGDQSLKISVLAALETEVFFTGALHYLCCLGCGVVEDGGGVTIMFQHYTVDSTPVSQLSATICLDADVSWEHLSACSTLSREYINNIISSLFIAPPPHQIDRELQQLLTFFVCKIRIVARNNNF